MIQHPSILITDDDLDFRETLRDVFEPRGFHTHLASDGEEAVRIVRSQEVHLALLDMHMPKLTGLQTLRLLKQFKSVLPCILMSAGLDQLLIDEAKQADAYTVLAKPVSRHRITATVDQALRWTYNWASDDAADD